MRCVLIFWFTIYLVEILSNVSLCVCARVRVRVSATELVKALVQNECTRTLSQRNVNVCRDIHSQKKTKTKANAFVPPKFETHLNKLAIKPLRCGWTGPSCELCFAN